MTVSVIVPTYNRRNLLIRALDSVFRQTLTPLEVIVVDDKSSFEVGRFLKDRYNVKVIRNPVNCGGAISRNIGVSNAKGEYIAFLDSDDYWAPAKLEKQLDKARSAPEVGLVYCDQWTVNAMGDMSASHKKLIRTDIWEHLLDGWTACNTSTLFFKKDCFHEIGGFDGRLTSCQDHDLWIKVALQDVKVEFCPERLSFFARDASDRISVDFHKRLAGAQSFLEKWRNEIIDSRGPRHFDWFRNTYLNKVAYPVFLSCVRKKDLKTALTVFSRYLAPNPDFHLYVKNRLAKIAEKLFG